jgi:hypothetical protein
MNHAICDACNFVATLQEVVDGTSSLQDAISAYSEEVVRRGADEVISSKQNSFMLLNWDQLMDSPILTRSLQKSENTST